MKAGRCHICKRVIRLNTDGTLRKHRVESAIESVGYRILAVEIDTDLGRARVEVRRHDGYTLTLDVRNGAGTITRERLRAESVAVGRRGDRFRADRIHMEFLGRTHVAGGARSALRAFADVIGENCSAGRLAARDAIRLLLTPESASCMPLPGEDRIMLTLLAHVDEITR